MLEEAVFDDRCRMQSISAARCGILVKNNRCECQHFCHLAFWSFCLFVCWCYCWSPATQKCVPTPDQIGSLFHCHSFTIHHSPSLQLKPLTDLISFLVTDHPSVTPIYYLSMSINYSIPYHMHSPEWMTIVETSHRLLVRAEVLGP